MQTAIKKIDATDGTTVNNKENISLSTEVFPSAYPPDTPVTYKYVPTMVGFEDFDKKYFLPKVTKKIKSNEQKVAVRNQKKNILLQKLNVNTEKMQAIKKCK